MNDDFQIWRLAANILNNSGLIHGLPFGKAQYPLSHHSRVTQKTSGSRMLDQFGETIIGSPYLWIVNPFC